MGQARKTRMEPDQAYGPQREEMLITVGKDRFPEDSDIQPGMQYEVGGGQMVVVVDVTDANVTLGGNHPLAGQALTFDIRMVSIR